MKLLLINRKLVLRGRKLALAIAGCFARCCATQSWNRADLCNEDEFPPNVPRIITFPAGFVCGDSCPVSGGRIIIYAGRCYTVVSGTGTVQCQGPRTAPAVYAAPFPGATVVAWQELSCKPLSATCLDETCVPVEPGCCTRPATWSCGGGNPLSVCNYPKRFRVTHIANYRWRSWVYADPGTCSGRTVCEEAFTSVNAWAEYACDENNVDSEGNSQAILVRKGGSITLTGHNLTPEGNNINGTYEPYAAPVYNNLTTAVGFGVEVPLRNLAFCAGSHGNAIEPEGCASESTTCPGGTRRIYTRTINCNGWQLDQLSYEDCFLYDEVYSSVGQYRPPCPADEAWNDEWTIRITLTILAGCESQPAWEAPPTGPGRPSPIPTAALISTAAMLQGMAG